MTRKSENKYTVHTFTQLHIKWEITELNQQILSAAEGCCSNSLPVDVNKGSFKLNEEQKQTTCNIIHTHVDKHRREGKLKRVNRLLKTTNATRVCLYSAGGGRKRLLQQECGVQGHTDWRFIGFVVHLEQH